MADEQKDEGHVPPKDDSEARERAISLGRYKLIGLTCLPLFVAALLLGYFQTSGRIAPRLTVAGVPVGFTVQADAEARLRGRAREVLGRKLRLKVAEKEAIVPVAELGFSLRPHDSVARALRVGRGSSFLVNAAQLLRSLFVPVTLPAELSVDRGRFEAALRSVEKSLIDDPPYAGGLAIEDGIPRVLPPRPGKAIALDQALVSFRQVIGSGQNDAAVTLETIEVSQGLAPDALDRGLREARRLLSQPVTLENGERHLVCSPAELGNLLAPRIQDGEIALLIDEPRLAAWLDGHSSSLSAPARDATFEVTPGDQVRVIPSQPGVTLSTSRVAEALLSAARAEQHRGTLPLVAEPLPKFSTEDAEALGIKQLVGSFTTRHPCCQPRVANIHRIATLVDGLLVKPGETVSLNAVVGPRTQKNGFVLAPSIEDGEMVDSVGGGVSQFATTIFNALFHAGYDIIERQPHTYWFPRYPMGHDATLGFPRPDIVFKNDSNAGLLVKTSFTETSITVKLYGDVGGRRVTSSVSERRDIVPQALELLPNREVPPDEEKIKDGGMIGWSVIASRTVTFADGTKKEEKRKVTYKPKPRRVEVHPCRIPKGLPGATGERCPEPPPEAATEAASGDTLQP